MKNFLLTLWYLPSHLWYKYKSWTWERKCIKYFGAKPQKIYLSKEDFDALVERLDQEPDPKATERIKQIMKQVSPWDNQV